MRNHTRYAGVTGLLRQGGLAPKVPVGDGLIAALGSDLTPSSVAAVRGLTPLARMG